MSNNNALGQKNKSVASKDTEENFLSQLLAKYPQYFDSVTSQKDKLGIQIIYTQIDRKKKGKAVFTDHYYQVDSNAYFYPASTVKFPVAVLALQKLNELRIAGLDKNTTMITMADGNGQTEVNNDPSASDGRPTIAHYIKKILLVSDNDAFNRLYEFLGQEYINNNLHKMGYTEAQIIHRLSISLSEEQNRHTNPVRFIDSSGKTIYEKPAERSQLTYAQRNIRLGKGYMRGDVLVNEPFDFSQKNRLSLASLHNMLRSVMFPQSVPARARFNISKDDYEFLYRYMSMLPGESVSPSYPSLPYWDNLVLFGSEKIKADTNIRIFNKTGTAYGYLTDVAYIIDHKNKIEWMVTAVIYCNSDGIFNDDKYDYVSLGYPFLQHLGEVLYEYELTRERKFKPDFSRLRFNYLE